MLEYLPGEYVLLEDRERGVPPRSFSIANAPRPNGLISPLVTRVPDGESSTSIHERLRIGEAASVSGPYGTFVDDPMSTGPALFLAAGSGLAPIRALLEAAVAANTRSWLTLIFSARKSNAACATRPHPLNLRAAPGSGTRVRYCPPRKGRSREIVGSRP